MGNNEGTKKQIRDFLENAIKNARNPNSRDMIKKERMQKAGKVAKRYGF